MEFRKVFIPTVIVSGVSFFLFSNFKIKSINCESQFGRCSDLILERVNLSEVRNYFIEKRKVSSLLSNEPTVKNFSIRYKLPSTLYIKIVEKTPEFALKKNTESKLVLIDKEGLVLRESDITETEVLKVNENLPQIGSKITDTLLFALKILNSLSMIVKVNDATLGENRLVVVEDTGINVIFPLTGDRDLLLGSFFLIQGELNNSKSDSTIKKENIREIDLRFKNPILRLK